MDIVYVTREGENPELRYSLRSLVNVPHSEVWIFGGRPPGLNYEMVLHEPRTQKVSPYQSTRDHIKAACTHPRVSDPFMLWNDDFYAMMPVVNMASLHRGSMSALLARHPKFGTAWWKGLRETLVVLERMGMEDPISYDVHVPMVVHKRQMLDALQVAKRVRADAIHLRSIYGNLASLGGVEIADPKMLNRSDPFPQGPWLSSGSNTFRSTVEPVLRYLFPEKSAYEKE